MVNSRLIGEDERKVILEWRQKERERDGIGSLERAGSMQEYRAAREAAAAQDAKNGGLKLRQ